MTERMQKTLFWLGGVTLLMAFLGVISNILLPFVVGMLVAYFLDPAADRLEKYGLSRLAATAIISLLFFSTVALALAALMPVLYDQLTALLRNVPKYIAAFKEQYGGTIRDWVDTLNETALPPGLEEKAAGASQAVLDYSAKFAAGLWESGMALINVMSLAFISPVVAFYLLRDYDRIVAKVDGWLPREHAATIRDLLRQMDSTLSAFIRGVSNVCLVMAVVYATGFSLAGLEFGLLIGLATGLFTFVPFVGPLIGYTLAMVVAWFQFDGELASVGMVALACAVGQFIESNFLTPNLVGGKVNLHPVWVIFGVLTGASLFGFVGVLLAVPLTAVLGVLVRFALQEYLKSGYYKGKKGRGQRA